MPISILHLRHIEFFASFEDSEINFAFYLFRDSEINCECPLLGIETIIIIEHYVNC